MIKSLEIVILVQPTENHKRWPADRADSVVPPAQTGAEKSRPSCKSCRSAIGNKSSPQYKPNRPWNLLSPAPRPLLPVERADPDGGPVLSAAMALITSKHPHFRWNQPILFPFLAQYSKVKIKRFRLLIFATFHELYGLLNQGVVLFGLNPLVPKEI